MPNVVRVRIEYWCSHDDKDPDQSNTVEHEVTANGTVVLRRNAASVSGICVPPFGRGERWDHRGTAGPYPSRLRPGGVPPGDKAPTQDKFDTTQDDDRTFYLDVVAVNLNGIPQGQGMGGTLTVYANGDQNWDDFSVRLYGITDQGGVIRYDPGNWVATKHKNQLGVATWAFAW